MTPMDIVDELKDDKLKADLRELLKKQPNYIPCCHIRQPMKKINPSNATLGSFIAMVGGSYVALLLFVFPYIYADGWFPIITIMWISTMVFFTATVKIKPGFMRGTSAIPFLRLVEKFEPNMLCPACEVICTSDSRHCYICNQCVERFDHHCQWVNNCIGIKNHSYFFFFICAQAIYMTSVVIMALMNLSFEVTAEILNEATRRCVLPIIVHNSTTAA